MTDQTKPHASRSILDWSIVILLAAILCALLYLAATGKRVDPSQKADAPPHGHEMLNAVLWQKTSAEFEAVTRQLYSLAQGNLKRALQDPEWSAIPNSKANAQLAPTAVVMDLDETVLDNTGYEEYLIVNHTEYSRESFQKWCESGKSSAIPGAAEFIRSTRDAGVEVIFMSARSEAQRACTTASLNRLGITSDGSKNEMLLTGGGEKQPFRDAVAKTHRVLLLVGDNLGDFTEGSLLNVEKRRQIARQYQEFWGKSWIILPNPMYGHWEGAVFAFDYAMPREKKLEQKHKSINSPE